MKITKSQLKRIIKEELENVLTEQGDAWMPIGAVTFYSGTPASDAEYVFQRECEWDDETEQESPIGKMKFHNLGEGKADINELRMVAKKALANPSYVRLMPVKVKSDPNITSINVYSFEHTKKEGWPPRC